MWILLTGMKFKFMPRKYLGINKAFRGIVLRVKHKNFLLHLVYRHNEVKDEMKGNSTMRLCRGFWDPPVTVKRMRVEPEVMASSE